jgi:16S rRNA C967 or C1407 C5-methylase (RsmB/RsmF family)
MEPEENEDVVAAVLGAERNARIVSVESRMGELLSEGILTDAAAEGLRDCITQEGYLRLLPGAFQTDGFFIALFEKAND